MNCAHFLSEALARGVRGRRGRSGVWAQRARPCYDAVGAGPWRPLSSGPTPMSARTPHRRDRRRRRANYDAQRDWIYRHGKLGGPGFLHRPTRDQHRLLAASVRRYGYRSTLGSLEVLNRTRLVRQRHGAKINALKAWLEFSYGGEGSFGPHRHRPTRKRRSNRRRRLENPYREFRTSSPAVVQVATQPGSPPSVASGLRLLRQYGGLTGSFTGDRARASFSTSMMAKRAAAALLGEGYRVRAVRGSTDLLANPRWRSRRRRRNRRRLR